MKLVILKKPLMQIFIIRPLMPEKTITQNMLTKWTPNIADFITERKMDLLGVMFGQIGVLLPLSV